MPFTALVTFFPHTRAKHLSEVVCLPGPPAALHSPAPDVAPHPSHSSGRLRADALFTSSTCRGPRSSRHRSFPEPVPLSLPLRTFIDIHFRFAHGQFILLFWSRPLGALARAAEPPRFCTSTLIQSPTQIDSTPSAAPHLHTANAIRATRVFMQYVGICGLELNAITILDIWIDAPEKGNCHQRFEHASTFIHAFNCILRLTYAELLNLLPEWSGQTPHCGSERRTGTMYPDPALPPKISIVRACAPSGHLQVSTFLK
ncbi:hypothetical protein FB451DRAFT_1554294 [Mycena latifolia]|nr:hypothetical protein FB451DRAFT_1554294 [Mycena latifolia]